jgi:hypothetical protein
MLDLVKIKRNRIRLGKLARRIFEPFIVVLIGACHISNVRMSD